MNREIKFRGWNKEKMTYYPSWFTLDKNRVLCFEEPPHNYVDDSDVDCPERIFLMQYTGMNDINGKEIYEGDILDSGGEGGYLGENVFVVWNNKELAWVVRTEGCSLRVMLRSPFADESIVWEVIGNIYETPEKIKGNE